MRAPRRVAAATAGGILALLGGEAGLRVAYPAAPPSLAALAEAAPEALGRRDPTDLAGCQAEPPPVPLNGDGLDAERPWLYVVGDSIAAGQGVPNDARFDERLRTALRATVHGPIGLVNDAVPGASLCEEVARTRRRLTISRRPRWAVVAVFADDLETHGAMYVGGRLVAWPENDLSPLLARAARASWLVNLAWYASVSRDPTRLDAAMRPEDRALYAQALQKADAALTAEPTRRVWALIAPAGIALCPPDAARTSRCGKLRDGAASLRALFATAGVPLVDLTGVWGERDYGLAAEHDADPDVVPIHPDADGHAVLAEALLPHLLDPASPP